MEKKKHTRLNIPLPKLNNSRVVIPDNILHFAEGSPLGFRQKFSFEGREWLKQILTDDSDIIAVLKGRQVGWSVLLAALMCYYALKYPGIQIMYCSMRIDQFRYFSRQRLKPVLDAYNIELSPDENRIKSMQLNNGSLITLVSGSDGFAQARGYSVDVLFLDEAQSLPIAELDNIKETLSNSTINKMYIGGTGGIEGFPWPKFWEATTKQEYVNDQWIKQNPDGEITSYHITQRLLPDWTQEKEDKKRRNSQSQATFEMEVLGIHTSVADIPLPENIAKQCLIDALWELPQYRPDIIYCSIDLAAGGEADTVLTISTVNQDTGHVRVLESVRSGKRLATEIFAEINPLITKWKPDKIASDAGGNDELLHLLSTEYNIIKYRLGPANNPIKYTDNKTDEYPISKSFFVQRVISRFHDKLITIPNAAPWILEQLTAEMQEVHESRTGGTTQIFTKIPGRKDDFLMSLVFLEALIYMETDPNNPLNRKFAVF